MPTTNLSAALALMNTVCIPALSMGYLCLVIGLCESEAWRRRLRP